MSRVVLKFGGSSLANIERIQHVARLVVQHAQNAQVIVVVSAMQGETDRLTQLAKSFQDLPVPCRELDQIIATGEVVSAAMLAMAIKAYGLKAQSMTGWQAKIKTTHVNQNARFTEMDPYPLLTLLDQKIIPIVTGFQGVADDMVTTLGRGGSDLSAIILSDVFKADACWIYTDVKGVYATDPNRCPNENIFAHLHYEQLQSMAWFGAEVVQFAAAQHALKQQVHIRVCSTFEPGEGTLVTHHQSARFPVIVQKSNISMLKWLVRPAESKLEALSASCMLDTTDAMVINAPLHHVQYLIRQIGVADNEYVLETHKTLVSMLYLTSSQMAVMRQANSVLRGYVVKEALTGFHLITDDKAATAVVQQLANELKLIDQPVAF